MQKSHLLITLTVMIVTLAGCPPKNNNPTTSDETESGISSVVGGTVEPDYLYPWVVQVSGTLTCHGVLIHPKWVLTAAHCVSTAASRVSLKRTDPYSGAVTEESRLPAGPGPMSGVFLHPQFNQPSANDNDIALVKLAEPFTITPYIQTVGIPANSRTAGTIGTVASYRGHTVMLPPDKVAIFRAPIPQQDFAPVIHINTNNLNASLCPGDSGSGFVTYENGRAFVRGITSAVNANTDCATPTGNEVDFADVFTHRDWIFQTIGMTDYFLDANTRLRRIGRLGRGTMGIGCTNDYGTMWGPLNVPGIQMGANCANEEQQSVVCSLSGSVGPFNVRIVSFTMKTTFENGAVETVSLPVSNNWASYFGERPFNAYREFTCRIGLADVHNPGEGPGLSQ